MLFSALSPAMASVLFSDRPDMLARMLALSTQSVERPLGDICQVGVGVPAEAVLLHHPSVSDVPLQDPSDHATHGIICSFCLVTGSVVTLPAGALSVAVMTAGSDAISPSVRVQPALANPASTRHPRDPPNVLR